jgi:hypothetical protein
MTGMKEGAGEDPFAEDERPEETEPERTITSTESAEPSTQESPTEQQSSADSDASENGNTTRERRQMRIPYKFRRDGVQDGRSRVPLFLQKETKRAERDAQRELEDRFDDDVSLTDLREALVMTGLEHLDELELQLEEWGYGMTFE